MRKTVELSFVSTCPRRDFETDHCATEHFSINIIVDSKKKNALVVIVLLVFDIEK